MMVGGASFSITLPYEQCVVPSGINGPVALYVTSDSQPLANNIRDQATNSVVAGPTMAFIDTQKQLLSQLALAASGSGNNSANDGTTTATITTITRFNPPNHIPNKHIHSTRILRPPQHNAPTRLSRIHHFHPFVEDIERGEES